MKSCIFITIFSLIIQINFVNVVTSGIIKLGPATLPILKDVYYVCLKTTPSDGNLDKIKAEHDEFFKGLNQRGISFTVRHEFFDYINGVSLVLSGGGLDTLQKITDISVVT